MSPIQKEAPMERLRASSACNEKRPPSSAFTNRPAALLSGRVPSSVMTLPANAVVTLVTFACPAVGARKPVEYVPRRVRRSPARHSAPSL